MRVPTTYFIVQLYPQICKFIVHELLNNRSSHITASRLIASLTDEQRLAKEEAVQRTHVNLSSQHPSTSSSDQHVVPPRLISSVSGQPPQHRNLSHNDLFQPHTRTRLSITSWSRTAAAYHVRPIELTLMHPQRGCSAAALPESYAAKFAVAIRTCVRAFARARPRALA